MPNVVETAPSTTSVSVESARDRRRSPRFPSQPATSLHVTFLLMSVAVIAASCLLSVNTTDKVTLPLTTIQLPSVCQFRNMTSLDCPGCGLTRSFIHIAHADFAGAWRYNAAGFLMFAFVAAQIPYRSAQLWRIRRGLPELRWWRVGNWALAIATTALVVQWIARLLWMLLT